MLKEKCLYLEAASGISGDMFAGAMLDLGADREALERALSSIPLTGFSVNYSYVEKKALRCFDFSVQLDEAHENHDHDMEYLFGTKHGHTPHESHGHSTHAHRHDAHEHRTLHDVREILWKVDMTEEACALADRIFYILAEAEAKAHGKEVDTVHFHEVGAVDSIVDIVAAAVCFDSLHISRVYIPQIFEGGGTVRCAHGLLPIPVPAVANIAEQYQLSLSVHPDTQGEFITPTGAAIAAAIMTDQTLPSQMHFTRVGYGAGKREYERPGFLRAFLFEQDRGEENIWKLETDLDDCRGEVLGYVMDRLFALGVREAHYSPIYMKKNRPAWTLTVLCDESLAAAAEEVIFSETTTIGIRKIKVERTILERESILLETSLGTAQIKRCMYRLQNGRTIRKNYPEYESIRELAEQSGKSLEETYGIVKECADQAYPVF